MSNRIPWTVQHLITATEDFTGAAPLGAKTSGANIHSPLTSYAASAAGGLFVQDCERPVWIERVHLKLGGQSAWTLTLFDEAGTAMGLIASGTNETNYTLVGSNRILWLPEERLKLVTTDMTAAGIARVTVRDAT